MCINDSCISVINLYVVKMKEGFVYVYIRLWILVSDLILMYKDE